MALTGQAFMALFHDVLEVDKTEYMEWHTREHMPERLGIPGFRTGKRLINHALERYQYGTLYSGDTVEVFRAPPYLERLNDPTPWTQRVQPSFRNFIRIACERIATAGIGDGGAMVTVRLDFTESDSAAASIINAPGR